MKTIYTLLLLSIACLFGGAAWGQTTIIGFNGNSSLVGTTALSPSSGTTANLGQTLSPVPSRTLTFGAACSKLYFCNAWDNGINSKYWYFTVNTTSFTNLQLTSSQKSSPTGPRDFKLQYSLNNGTTWNDITNIVSLDSNSCNTSTISLPAVTNNVAALQLRWIMYSNTSTRGGANIVAVGGTSSITNVLLTGLPSTPTTTSISPVSTNAGGSSFTLTVNGTNFINGLSYITWNGAQLTITYVSSTQLTATVPASNIALPGTASIGVTTTGASVSSNTQLFTIIPNGSAPPTISPASSATVDNPFTVTFTDDPLWRSTITSITVGGTALPTSAYDTTNPGKIIFDPSKSSLLYTAGVKSIIIYATGYNNGNVSQTINPGVPANLIVATQPIGPTANGGTLTTQPVVGVKDQYSNPVIAGYTINASVPAAQTSNWALGGTTTATTNSSGNASFTGLTATNNTAAPYAANITFSYGSVNATSNAFTIPATAPTLTAASGTTVDNPFNVTFTDNATWRGAISSIKVGTYTFVSGTDYTVSAGQITFIPTASNPFSTPGTYTIVITATGYSTTSVSQSISAGAPATLMITKQPAAPTTYTGTLTTQPVVKAVDKYGNLVSGTYTITAAVSTGQVGSWTLGGTTGVNTVSGLATYTNLTATNLTTSAYTATITFSYSSASVTSNPFIIPPPPPGNDDCSNAFTLTPAASPTATIGTFVSATSSPALTNDPTKKDVWYSFTPTCTSLHTVTVNFSSGDVDFEIYTGSCPSSGAGTYYAQVNGGSSETRTIQFLAGTTYYVRVIEHISIGGGTFTISVTVNPPAQPSPISGIATPCLGNTETYSVNTIAGVNYTWTLPGADWSGSSTTSSIVAVIGSTAGNVTVTPSNTCGLSGTPQTLAVTPVTTAIDITNANVNAGNGRLSITWTNPNCFDKIMVVATDNSTVTLVPTGNGSLYVDTTEYASLSPDNSVNMNPGEYCIYKGTASAITMTGLLNNDKYAIKIYTLWGTTWSPGVQIFGTPVVASAGAFRSRLSGNWTDGTIWEKFVSGIWGPTAGPSDYPNYYTSNVSIEAGTTVVLNSSPMAVNNLDIKSNARLWSGKPDSSFYLNYVSVFGDLTCDGIIGNPNPLLQDAIGFNFNGGSSTISGTGTFSCARIRKNYDASNFGASNTTNLYINKNINCTWPGTVMYNATTPPDTTKPTNFNVTLSSGYIMKCTDPVGSICIDGINAGNNSYAAAGKYTINGALTIPGNLYLSTNNNGYGPCVFEIGSGGVVNAAIIRATASGTATHSLVIKTNGLLNITDSTAFAIYAPLNNITTFSTGSTIQYAALTGQQVLSGLTYQNLVIGGAGQKIISNAYSSATVNGNLAINAGTFSIGAGKTLVLNGTTSGSGSITGSGTANITIGPNTTPTTTPLGVLRFTPGHDSLGTLTMDRQMKADVYPTHKYWAAVLGSNLNVSTLTLNQGILATNTYLLTLLNYPASTYAAYNGASYIATTDTLATAFNIGNTFNGSFGLRINGVKANTDTYFPVGADFISPNRVYIKLNSSAPTRNLTVALTKGDIIRTGSPRVNRIWYMNSSVNDSVNAAMRLYYTGYSLASYPYLVKQDELETGFTGLGVRLVEKANMSDTYFTNISNGADTMVNFSPGTEVYAKYTASVSTIYNGTKPGIYKFNVFSIVDGNNVVLPVNFTSIRAYQQGTGINISWSVANEVDIDHYEVERAGDARLFSTIASQKAQNTNSYTATDMQPLKAANYYRIKAVGKDGQVLYSTVVNVTLGSDGKMSIVVYPNPVKFNQCHVLLNNLAAGNYNIAVYSMAGQLITTKQVEHPGGSSSEKLNLPAGTAAGVYVVKISGQNVTMQTSVFVSGK